MAPQSDDIDDERANNLTSMIEDLEFHQDRFSSWESAFFANIYHLGPDEITDSQRWSLSQMWTKYCGV